MGFAFTKTSLILWKAARFSRDSNRWWIKYMISTKPFEQGSWCFCLFRAGNKGSDVELSRKLGYRRYFAVPMHFLEKQWGDLLILILTT
ncbi:hypothetical protein AWJ19_21370 [Paenibacillus sp. DMB5]|nr:hypothetical protein AWJ19_21370 [Paenibacillus sp. DMB5]